MVSREVKLHQYYKQCLEKLGFDDVTITDKDKDGLNFIIEKMKPDLILIEACFYEGCTPYMMMELLDYFPDLNIAAVNVYRYPDDTAMWFILNGIKSYVNWLEGKDEFYKGMEIVRKGRQYISPNVQYRISLRKEYPQKAKRITLREAEVRKCMCCGFKDDEIADVLGISQRTVDTHRTAILRSLNVRNSTELLINVLKLGIHTLDEIAFFHRSFLTNPNPTKKYHVKMREKKVVNN